MSDSQELPLTEKEVEQFRRIGGVIMVAAIASVTLAMLSGIHLVYALKAINILRKKEIASSSLKARLCLLATTVVFLICSLTYLALDVYTFVFVIVAILLAGFVDGQTWTERVSSVDPSLSWVKLTFVCLLGLEFLLGDAIVIWRAWAVWGGQRRATIPLVAAWMISFALWVSSLTLGIIDPATIFDGESLSSLIFVLGSLLCCPIINALATGFIAYKTWQHRKAMRAYLDSSEHNSSRAVKVLILLVESGVVYLIIWIISWVVGSHVDEDRYNACAIIGLAMGRALRVAVGIYPTLVIILVQQQKSAWDSPEVSGAISTLRFASRSNLPAEEADSLGNIEDRASFNIPSQVQAL